MWLEMISTMVMVVVIWIVILPIVEGCGRSESKIIREQKEKIFIADG